MPTLHMGPEKKPKGITARETRMMARNILEREVERLKDDNKVLQETAEHKDIDTVFKSVRRNNPLKPLQINQETTDVEVESNARNELMIKMEDVFDNTIERSDILLDISFEKVSIDG